MSCNHCKMRILQYLFVTSARYMIKIVPCSTLGTRPLTKIQLVILNLHIKQLNSSLFSTAPNTCMQNWQSDMEFVEDKKMNTARNLWQPEKTRSNCRKKCDTFIYRRYNSRYVVYQHWLFRQENQTCQCFTELFLLSTVTFNNSNENGIHITFLLPPLDTWSR